MRRVDVGLAVVVAALWGLAFVATRVGLDAFSPPQLTAIRFAVAALPVLVLAGLAVIVARSPRSLPSGSRTSFVASWEAIDTTRAPERERR